MACPMNPSGKGSGICMYKAAVLGDYGSIYGFAALGLDIFPVSEPEEAANTLHRLAAGDYAIIYVTEALAASIDRDIKKHSSSLLPSIIPIPGISGNTGEGVESIKKSVEKAVGSDIIFSNN